MRRFLILLVGAAAALSAVVVIPAPASAIVNGTDAHTNPGVVSIYTDNPYRNRCGGTLIRADMILTAAHCYSSLTKPDAGRVDVRIGSTDNTVPCASDAEAQSGRDCYISRTIAPEDYYLHPDFDQSLGLKNDVMVARLNAPVPSAVQEPVRWRTSPLQIGTVFRIAGWGWVCDGPPELDCSTWYAGKLQQMQGKVVSSAECPEIDDAATQACFQDSQGGFVMACPGDSGTGGFTKGPDGKLVVRLVVVGDGDDAGGRSCTTAPDGSPGAGYGIDVGRYQEFIEKAIYELSH